MAAYTLTGACVQQVSIATQYSLISRDETSLLSLDGSSSTLLRTLYFRYLLRNILGMISWVWLTHTHPHTDAPI